MLLYQRLIRVQGSAWAATTRNIANSETSARNSLRGPDFIGRDFCLTKWFPLTEHAKLRFERQLFNVFNHPNFGLPRLRFREVDQQRARPGRDSLGKPNAPEYIGLAHLLIQ
jgi:hypothetical protein